MRSVADAAATRGSGPPAGAAAGSSDATTCALPAQSMPLIGRQRMSRASIGWTYDLLSRTETALSLALAVFVGCFALDRAEALAAGVGGGMLTELPSLVEQSLLQRHDPLTGGGEPRVRMLETVRAFALERLVASGVAERRVVRGPSGASASAAGPVRIRAPPGPSTGF